MLLSIVLTFHILVCLALIGVVLLQRSEGGALGMGGGPTGFMSTRGVGDVLTRITWGLFAAFLALSLLLTVLGARQTATDSVVDRLNIEKSDPATSSQPTPAPAPAAPAPLQAPMPGLPFPTQAPVPAAPTVQNPAPAPEPNAPNQR